MAELVDAQGWGPCEKILLVGVQVSFPAKNIFLKTIIINNNFKTKLFT